MICLSGIQFAYYAWKNLFWFDMPNYPHWGDLVTREELRLHFFDALSGIENEDPFWMRSRKKAKHLEEIFNAIN